jgi:nitric oxide reductase subunit B
MYRSEQLALRYLIASTTIFGIMIVAGLMAATYYVDSNFLFNTFNFSTAKILHIDGLVIWLLLGFMGSVYWFLPKELGWWLLSLCITSSPLRLRRGN